MCHEANSADRVYFGELLLCSENNLKVKSLVYGLSACGFCGGQGDTCTCVVTSAHYVARAKGAMLEF